MAAASSRYIEPLLPAAVAADGQTEDRLRNKVTSVPERTPLTEQLVSWGPRKAAASVGRRPDAQVVPVPERRRDALVFVRHGGPAGTIEEEADTTRRPSPQVVPVPQDRRFADQYIVIRWGGPASAPIPRRKDFQVVPVPEDPRLQQPFGFQTWRAPAPLVPFRRGHQATPAAFTPLPGGDSLSWRAPKTVPVVLDRGRQIQVLGVPEDRRGWHIPLLVRYGGAAGIIEPEPEPGVTARLRTILGVGV